MTKNLIAEYRTQRTVTPATQAERHSPAVTAAAAEGAARTAKRLRVRN